MKRKINNILMLSFAVLLLLSCNSKVEVPATDNSYYTCSMDPQVRENKPGKCPICRMELTKVEASTENSNTLKFSDNQMKLANIKVNTVKISSFSQEQIFTAKVVVDEEESSVIAARIMGRVDKLNFKSMGQYIHKGDVVYELYSEELSSAQKEYLIALERAKKINDTETDYKQLLSSAKSKLLLWGMNEEQIKQLELSGKVPVITEFTSKVEGFVTEVMIKEGDYLTEGQAILKTNTFSSVWVEAQIFSAEIQGIKLGQEVLITIDGQELEAQKSKINFISPELMKQSKINIIRAALQNDKQQYFPGMLASITLNSSQKKTMILPLDAVLQEAKGNTIWVQNMDGSFESRMVTIGSQNSREIEILSGIKIGEIVVVSGAFLINSEYRLKKGSDPMEGMKM